MSARARRIYEYSAPYFFAFRVPAHHTINKWRLARLRMRIVVSNCIHLDVLGVVDVNKFLIDVRTIRAREVQLRV